MSLTIKFVMVAMFVGIVVSAPFVFLGWPNHDFIPLAVIGLSGVCIILMLPGKRRLD